MRWTRLIDGDGRERLPRLRVAETRWETTRGLLGRAGLEEGEGLWLPGCGAIHMWFMRFPVDAVFVDGAGTVVRVVEGLRPWRMAWARGARSVLELSAGGAAKAGLARGMTLRLDE